MDSPSIIFTLCQPVNAVCFPFKIIKNIQNALAWAVEPITPYEQAEGDTRRLPLAEGRKWRRVAVNYAN